MYGDFRKLFTDIKDNWKGIRQRIQYSNSKFFYKEEFISQLIFNRSFDNLPKDEFIDYSLAFKYYEANQKIILISRGGEGKKINIPYFELVNFIENPEYTLMTKGAIEDFKLDNQVMSETEVAFNSFISARPQTRNNKVLRVNALNILGTNVLEIELSKATYFDLIRTNLTLDFPMKSDNLSTLRVADLGDSNNLKPFNESILANSIGVSTVLTYHSKGDYYFYMKPRKGKLGVFNNMLGSISGVVEPPNDIFDVQDGLLPHIKKEILRELAEETGLSIENISKNPSFDIVPLSFTRELTRGGKPQFFFLVVIQEISEKEFNKIFENSVGNEEFKNDWITNITSFDDCISPEFTTNLIYAKQYIQKKRKLLIEPVQL